MNYFTILLYFGFLLLIMLNTLQSEYYSPHDANDNLKFVLFNKSHWIFIKKKLSSVFDIHFVYR